MNQTTLPVPTQQQLGVRPGHQRTGLIAACRAAASLVTHTVPSSKLFQLTFASLIDA